MLEGLAYVGWWFRELVHLIVWWICVGYPHLVRELDNRRNRSVGWRRREEQDD